MTIKPLTTALQAAGLATLFLALPVWAEPTLDDMVVSATRDPKDAFDIPASVDKVNAETLRNAGGFQVNLSETLVRVPGLVINNRNNFAQDLQISIRGFGARSTSGVRGVRLFADGIPATMPDGSGQISHFSLSSAESIEVLRGPFSSLYGNSSGGVIVVTTEDPKPGQSIEFSGALGSDSTRRAGVKFNTGSENFGWVLDASRFETDGYRDHSKATRDNLNSKMKFKLGDTRLTWLVNTVDMPDVQDPLGLTANQLAANRRQAGTNAVARNSRKSVQQSQTGLVVEHDFTPTTGLVFSPYVGERSIRQVLASGTVIDLNNEYYGADLRLRHQTSLLNMPLLLSVGMTVGELEQARKGAATETAPINRNESNTASQFDQYAQAEWLLSDEWSVFGGLRYSTVDIQSANLLAPSGSGAREHTATTSNMGVTYALSDTQKVYASFGEGFETPTLLETAYSPMISSPTFNAKLNAAKSRQYEVGYKARYGQTKVNVALYAVDTKDEIVVDTASGGVTVFQNAGKTWREGLELGLQHRFNTQWQAAMALNIINAEYKNNAVTPSATYKAGNNLPSIPGQTAFAELVYKPADRLETAAEFRYIGGLYANDANTAETATATVWNWRINHSLPLGSGWTLRTQARVDNVFAKEYVGSVIVNQAQGQFYEPAATRQVLVGASLAYRW